MNNLQPPENFDFPYVPYSIQNDFMRKLFETLENKQCGIFESPTGTGKSMSIICGALQWLADHNNQHKTHLTTKIQELTDNIEKLKINSTDWLESQSKEIEITKELNIFKNDINKIEEYSKKISSLKSNKAKVTKVKSFINKNKEKGEDESFSSQNDDLDDDLIPNDVDLVESDQSSDEESEDDKYVPIKIFICSRTHSQLSQFIGEIRKSPFSKDARVVSLASRQNYCINPEVVKLKNINLINQRCLDMQKSTGKTVRDDDGKAVKRQKGTNCKCPYYKQTAIDELRDLTLVEIQDIEDLVTIGKEIKACPYYSSRKAVEDAEIVLVPYNTILHKATRQANGIHLKNNVVIIDEAHNLLEALAQIYSAELKYEQLQLCNEQLKAYKMKYSTRFSSQNLLYINQLLFVTAQLRKELDKVVSTNNESQTEIFQVQNFVLSAEIDNYNMFKLVKFIKDSKLAQKLHGFALRYPEPIPSIKVAKKGIKNFLNSIENKSIPELITKPLDDIIKVPQPQLGNPLIAVSTFLEVLTNAYENGRILIHRGDCKRLQFTLLNPTTYFKDIVKDARSVIVAGGTMKPISEFGDRLFINAGAEASRIVNFSCDHIIPPNHILPVIIKKGPHNDNLLFNFENRFKMGNSIKTLLEDTCKVVKGGIVVFFPSYKYEAWVWDLLKNINFGRPVFREPQHSGSVDSVLEKYQKAIYGTGRKGALLFSVVGGKLSEGLNFSDDLGRCVIVIGLPYANIHAPDLKEKMAFLDKTEGSGSGKKLFENMCMKAVNQCIGRAVRHKEDYATVILYDERYDRQTTKNALPDWIKRSLISTPYKDAFQHISQFFSAREQKN